MARETTRRSWMRGISSLVMALSTLGLSAICQADSPPITLVVIVGKDNGMNDISQNTLRNAFLGESVSDPSGKKIIPLNHPPHSSERVGFDRIVLDMSPDEAARYWIDRKIRGQSGAPRAVDSPALLRRVVARLPGALSYIRREDVDDSVKVLRIDGKRPSDGDYPLRYRP
jgi:hypothetical protein